MAQGTGIPLPQIHNDLATAPSVSADAVSSAAAWTKIAAAGQQITSSAFDTLEKDVHLQQAGAVADFENDWRAQNIEARNKYANDPDGFKNWAESSIEGAVGSVQPWMASHAKSYLSRTFDGSYASILGEKRAKDDALAGDALKARRATADEDVMGLASAGKLNTSEGNAAVAVHTSVLDTAVKAGAMSQDQANYLRDDLQGRATGEIAARQAVQVYREQGFDAAVGYLQKNIRENEDLSLKQSQRDKAFNRGLSQIRLEQARDKEDKGAIVEASKDLRARITNNESPDPNEVKSIADELARTGAWTERRQLMISAGVADATAAYRPGGGKTIPQLGADLARMRGELTPGLNGAIEAAAFRRGVSPDYLKSTAIRESGGDVNAKARTSSAEGPFQFTDQTWLAEVKRSGPDIGLGDAANLIQKVGNKYVVSDPQAAASIMALRRDPAVSAEMAAGLTAGNAAALRAATGRDATPGELYAAHFLGADGAVAMMKADPGAKAADINPSAAAANTSIFFAKDGRPKSVGEVLANLNRSPAPDDTQATLGAVTKGVQQFYVAQEKKTWPTMKSMMEKGELTDPTEFEALRYAAHVSGDAAWAQEVESFATAQGYGRLLKAAPEGQGQAILDRARSRFGGEGATVSEHQVLDTIQKQYDRQVRMAKEDPIGLALETDPTLKPPAPLDFSNSDAARAGLNDRVALTRRAAVSKDTPLGSPLRPSDRAATAAAIGYGQPAQTAAAFDMLASAPDDALLPTLQGKEIKDAVGGAARSSDGGRYNAAMSFLDRLWQRAPESVDNLFGSDVTKELAAWQISRRYMTPEDQAKARSASALDPQVRERRNAAFDQGLELARKVKPEDVVGKFDQSWWVTPGIVARNVTGTQPVGPGDPIALATLTADWQQNYARIYADTLDKDKAAEKATELTRTKWTASPLNGGRLMLSAPEKYYPAVNGNWDWMKGQLEDDLGKALGPRVPQPPSYPGALVPGIPGNSAPQPSYDWELIADRQSESEAQAGKPPSYLVRITDNKKGGAISIMPQRYVWNSDAGPGNPTEAFQRQRDRVLASNETIAAQGLNDRRRLELY